VYDNKPAAPLVLPRWRATYNQKDKLVYIRLGPQNVITFTPDEALLFARDVVEACGADSGLQSEACPCGSGKAYGKCCLGSGV
jgi:hypothetical protein